MSPTRGVVGLILGALSASLLAADPDPAAQLLDTYLGLTEEQVVQRAGPPDFVYQTDDTKYLAYERPPSGATQTGGSQGFAYPRNCQWGFKLHKDRVVTDRYEGKACLAQLEMERATPHAIAAGRH